MSINNQAITSYVDFLRKENNLDIHSFMMIKDDQTIWEEYYRPYEKETPHVMYSVSKSFTSTAIGLAVDKGMLSVEDSVYSFFPEYKDLCDSEYKRALKVKHLLSMSTGFTSDESKIFSEYDFVRTILSNPIEHEPGTVFNYFTAGTYMLAAIFKKVMGVNVHDYLKQGLFKSMDINDTQWLSCPKEITYGGFGLYIKTSDMIKLGCLYLNKGVYKGERLLSESWVDEATRKQVDNDGPDKQIDWTQGYGYQFWRCCFDAFRADGMNGQYIIVKPDMNLVAAITSNIQDMQIPLTGFAEMIKNLEA